MDILGAITVAKQSVELAKSLKGIDVRINDAEFKQRILDLVDQLMNVRGALMDAQEREMELRKKVTELEAKLSERGKFEDENGLLFALDENGARIGEPYCNHCFVKEEKLYRLLYGPYTLGSHRCSNCKKTYGSRERSSLSVETTSYDF